MTMQRQRNETQIAYMLRQLKAEWQAEALEDAAHSLACLPPNTVLTAGRRSAEKLLRARAELIKNGEF